MEDWEYLSIKLAMDYVSSIFDIDSAIIGDNDLFQLPSFECQQETLLLEDELLFKPSEDFSDLPRKIKCSRRRMSSKAFGEKDDNPNDTKRKKLIEHRDIERQRRQEMSTLYRSLRSLLPLDYLKGKRSTSDQVHQAANYIKHLEEKIQELSDKRDELKRLSSSGPSSSTDEVESLEGCGRDIVTVNPCWVGAEVAVNTSASKGLPLSRVLQVIVQEGFGVVSCVSTNVNGRMLHAIHIRSEKSDRGSVDIPELEQKIANSKTRPEN